MAGSPNEMFVDQVFKKFAAHGIQKGESIKADGMEMELSKDGKQIEVRVNGLQIKFGRDGDIVCHPFFPEADSAKQDVMEVIELLLEKKEIPGSVPQKSCGQRVAASKRQIQSTGNAP
jgi:hypothetical protein